MKGILRLFRLLKRGRPNPNLVEPSTWEELFEGLGESRARYDELDKEFSQMQEKLDKARRLLVHAGDEFDDLYSSRKNVLKQIGELVIKYERRGYPQLARDLEEILLLAKLERYEPAIGEPVQSGKCVVDGKLKSEMFPPCSVVMVSAPGFCSADGQMVALPAHVYQCVPPAQSVRDKITLNKLADEDSNESRALSHYLLLRACTLSSKEPSKQ